MWYIVIFDSIFLRNYTNILYINYYNWYFVFSSGAKSMVYPLKKFTIKLNVINFDGRLTWPDPITFSKFNCSISYTLYIIYFQICKRSTLYIHLFILSVIYCFMNFWPTFKIYVLIWLFKFRDYFKQKYLFLTYLGSKLEVWF